MGRRLWSGAHMFSPSRKRREMETVGRQRLIRNHPVIFDQAIMRKQLTIRHFHFTALPWLEA